MKKLLTLALFTLSCLSLAQDANTADSSDLGTYLTDSGGMTLYVFEQDVQGSGESACYGDCAAAWPPFVVSIKETFDVPAGSAEFGTLTRKDGSVQITYDGFPLYYWEGDREPGDTLGHGAGEVWFVAEGQEPTAEPEAKTSASDY